MHTTVFYLGIAWAAALFGTCIALSIRAGSVLARILALDILALVLIVLLVLFAYVRHSPFYLDAALTLSILSFIGTLAATHYHSEGRPFS